MDKGDNVFQFPGGKRASKNTEPPQPNDAPAGSPKIVDLKGRRERPAAQPNSPAASDELPGEMLSKIVDAFPRGTTETNAEEGVEDIDPQLIEYFDKMVTFLVALKKSDSRSYSKKNIEERKISGIDVVDLLEIIRGSSEFDWKSEPSNYHAVCEAIDVWLAENPSRKLPSALTVIILRYALMLKLS